MSLKQDLSWINNYIRMLFHAKHWCLIWKLLTKWHECDCRGRPWRYSVIPSTPDFPTEYQIRRHSNPAGLPTFAAIWGPDFRASIIRLTCPHVFKQIKKYNYFDDDVQSQSSPTKLRRPTVIGMQRRGTRADGYPLRWSPAHRRGYPGYLRHRRLLVVYSARGFLARIVCFEGATPAFQSW